jgi:hypothetical protein
VNEPRESPVTIAAGGAELIPRLAPLWMAPQEHHASIAPEIARVRAFRTSKDSWSVPRRRQYEQWLQQDGARLLIAEQGAR